MASGGWPAHCGGARVGQFGNGPPERPAKFWFDTYSKSAERFRDIAARAGADVIIANHTVFDGTKTKVPALASRQPGQKNPYVIGKEGVLQYMTVVDECAKAGLALQQ